jgi:hypothetical protein
MARGTAGGGGFEAALRVDFRWAIFEYIFNPGAAAGPPHVGSRVELAS